MFYPENDPPGPDSAAGPAPAAEPALAAEPYHVAEPDPPAKPDQAAVADAAAEPDPPAEPGMAAQADAAAAPDPAAEQDLAAALPAAVSNPAVETDAAAALDGAAASGPAANAGASGDLTSIEKLAEAYYGGGFYLLSLETYTKIMEINPEKTLFCLTRIGVIHTVLGKHEVAMATFEAVLQADPNFLSALKGISETLIKDARAKSVEKQYALARNSTQSAVYHLIRALTITKKYPAFWKLLAGALLLLTKLPDPYCFVEITFHRNDDIGIDGYLCMNKNIYKLSEFCYWYGRSVMSAQIKRVRGRQLTEEILEAEHSYEELRHYYRNGLGLTYTDMVDDGYGSKPNRDTHGI